MPALAILGFWISGMAKVAFEPRNGTQGPGRFYFCCVLVPAF